MHAFSLTCCCALVLFTTGLARADTIWLTSGGAGGAGAGGAGAGGSGGGLEMGQVRIEEVRDGKIIFRTSAGRESFRDVAQVSRLFADGELALNAAEDALAKGDFDSASDGFLKALSSSARPWVTLWSAQRLTVAAQKANRFDAAAAGYVALLLRDPPRAANYKPAMPAARSTFIASAIKQARAALAAADLSTEQRQGLEAFLGELQQARAEAGAGVAASAAAPGSAASASAPAPRAAGEHSVAAAAHAAASSVADQQAARARLDAANAALERKDYAGAINEIRSNARLLTEARDQAQALYFIAEAQLGLAGATNDVPSWQDAALAYLRVVAHFHDAPPARALVARAMLKAAQVQERVNDPAAARLLYEQLTREFPADPAAADARAALERLKGKP